MGEDGEHKSKVAQLCTGSRIFPFLIWQILFYKMPIPFSLVLSEKRWDFSSIYGDKSVIPYKIKPLFGVVYFFNSIFYIKFYR